MRQTTIWDELTPTAPGTLEKNYSLCERLPVPPEDEVVLHDLARGES